MTQSLASDIQQVFCDTQPPSADAISVPTYDDEGTQAHFGGTHWRDHSAKTLENHTFALEIFTPAAFCYFLPAFLLAALESDAGGLKDSVVMKLCPPKNNPLRPSYFEWWRQLTPEQRRVVVQFLRHFAHENPNHLEPVVVSLEATVVVKPFRQ